MRLASVSLVLALASIPLAQQLTAQDQVQPEITARLAPEVLPFVEKYCSECHNDFVSEGDRTFDPFLDDPHSEKNHLAIEEMLDQLNLGKMPKKQKDVPQPSQEERRAITAALTQYLTVVTASEKPVETPLRRLTRVEYANTMRDLFGIDPDASSAIASFPPDANAHGFTNLGEAQTLSQAQLGAYVAAAEEVVDALFARHESEAVQPERLVFYADDIGHVTDAVTPTPFGHVDGPDAILSPHELAFKSATDTSLYIGGGRVAGERPYYPRALFQSGGVPADGLYHIRVTAEALNRFEPFDTQKTQFDPKAQPLKLAIGVARDNRQFEVVQALDRKHAAFLDLPDDGAQEFMLTLRMNKGNVPFIFWPNGPHRPDNLLQRIMETYHPEAAAQNVNANGNLLTMPTWGVSPGLLRYLREDYHGPLVRLHVMEVEGPFPLESEEVFDPETFAALIERPASEVDDVLADFASAAFRRPTAPRDIAPFIAFTRGKMLGGTEYREALRLGFVAILASPRFLFLDEGNSEDSSRLDQFELASRLSYFLWSSMPDAALLDDAAAGRLGEAEVVDAHVQRMLADDKAGAFISGFLKSWLRLDKLGSMPPDTRIYPGYYKNRLESAMRSETELLFRDVLKHNKRPSTFLTADYTFVNDSLAAHYGVAGEFGEGFEQVALPAGSGRQGLAGHASVLTASANGVETSPVLRGVWVLENLLGTPPSPPPPDVPALEPDTRGATTVRDLLARHRDVPACADCHAFIDPYGFPLEAFGPIGERRERYPLVEEGRTRLNKGVLIDLSAELANGEQIATLADFHGELTDNTRSFQINLMSKLLTYGTGREMTFRDRPEIEAMIDALDADEAGLRDMIKAAVTSEIFATR